VKPFFVACMALAAAVLPAAAQAQSEPDVKMIAGWGVVEDVDACALVRIDGEQTLKFMFMDNTDAMLITSPAINGLTSGDRHVLTFEFSGGKTVGGIGFVQGNAQRKTLAVIANPESWLNSFRASSGVAGEVYESGPKLFSISYSAGAGAAYDAYLACRARKKG